MNFAKPALLSKIMLAYSILLSVILFPFASKNSAWIVYGSILLVAYLLTFMMFMLAKKRRKEV